MTVTLRSLSVALAVSLALNVFLAGFLAAQALRPSEGRPSAAGPMLFRAGEALGDPGHPAIREVMRAHRQELRAHRRAIREARREVHESMVAEPFDQERLSAALASLRAETTSSQVLLHRALVQLATSMTPEQRARLSKLSEEPPPRSRSRNR